MNEAGKRSDSRHSAATGKPIEASLFARFSEEFRVDPAMQALHELVGTHCVRALSCPAPPAERGLKKARQYAEPLRADFGAFVRACGFRMRQNRPL